MVGFHCYSQCSSGVIGSHYSFPPTLLLAFSTDANMETSWHSHGKESRIDSRFSQRSHSYTNANIYTRTFHHASQCQEPKWSLVMEGDEDGSLREKRNNGSQKVHFSYRLPEHMIRWIGVIWILFTCNHTLGSWDGQRPMRLWGSTLPRTDCSIALLFHMDLLYRWIWRQLQVGALVRQYMGMTEITRFVISSAR